ncbi:MAG: NADH-quinone oxidoreductase subunit M, partial [Verrucomicrobiales bacterium VVV1]
MNALLSALIFTPWLGALVLALVPGLSPKLSRRHAQLFSFSTLALALVACTGFDPNLPGYQFVERHAWIGVLNVSYHLGLDGMSLLLVLLTGLVGPVALLASWKIERDVR